MDDFYSFPARLIGFEAEFSCQENPCYDTPATITPIYDSQSCEAAQFSTIPTLLYTLEDSTLSVSLPTFTTAWGETCDYTVVSLTITPIDTHTTINSVSETIEIYSADAADIGDHSATLTLRNTHQ